MSIGRSLVTGMRRFQGVRIGQGAYVSPKAMLREPKSIALGDRTTVGRFAEINPQGGRITIGSDCSIHNFCVLYGAGGISIGTGCRIANGATLIAFNHAIDGCSPIRTQPITRKGITIESDVWIGARAIVLDGVTIGRGSVIGAGTVVSRDVTPGSIVVGSLGRKSWRRPNFGGAFAEPS